MQERFELGIKCPVLREINMFAEDVANIYKIHVPIQDMDTVVALLGGSVKKAGLYENYGVQKRGSGFLITIPPYKNDRWEKLFAAKNLGHLFLHMGYLTNDKIWTFQKDGRIFEGTYEEECRTNVFAEAFLMPKNMYMDVLEKESEKSIINLKKIAGFFDVPVETAFRRGRFLRCLRG